MDLGRGFSTHAEFEDFNHEIVLVMVFEFGTGLVLERRRFNGN